MICKRVFRLPSYFELKNGYEKNDNPYMLASNIITYCQRQEAVDTSIENLIKIYKLASQEYIEKK